VTTGNDGLIHAAEVARGLVGSAVEVSRLPMKGRNSRIWRVRTGDNDYALKQYPPRAGDPRDRLATEVGALRLMERFRITTVPRVLGIDDAQGYALLSWIDGSDVTDIGNEDIDSAVNFLRAIHDLRTAPWAVEQPPAAEACLSGAEIERQIANRMVRLAKIHDEPQLIDFIENSFKPVFSLNRAEMKSVAAAADLAFDVELPQEWQSLVPSDFGFHNSLRRPDGSLAFLDFEYFGWDDPVKLIADIMLHPGRALANPQRLRFRKAAQDVYSNDSAFVRRLSTYLPLFGLRWVLILLNEFIPERWQRRVLAGDVESWDEAKTRQLARAKSFLASLPQMME
jgi:hypothetical protein